jgi:penicillin-binding protein 1C
MHLRRSVPFTPENFDGRFVGPIAAQDALIRSRNIPAVWAASQLTQPTLYQFLESAGIRDLKPEAFYGLALALGGGEVTMEELAGLYAMLANGGELKPIRMTASDVLAGDGRTGAKVQGPNATVPACDCSVRGELHHARHASA